MTMHSFTDAFGAQISATHPGTQAIWNTAMADFTNYSGNPVGDLDALEDETCLSAHAFCTAMRLLSGADPNGKGVQGSLAKVRRAAPHVSGAEAMHAKAVEAMAQYKYTLAASLWDDILAARPHDMLAHKCAHETWFLIGAIPDMLRSAQQAISRLSLDDPSYAVASANVGFALEESGQYAQAESWGRLALDLSPSDCWALHCLAHVYESQNRHTASMDLLNAKQPIWSQQNLLNAHIWWHFALRQIEAGNTDAALAIFDETLSEAKASDRFRLTDGTSLLWRLELIGTDVGARWTLMADKWGRAADMHTNAFHDLHAAFAFARCTDHSATDLFFDTLDSAFAGQENQNAQVFTEVLKPLASAIRHYRSDPQGAAQIIAPLLPQLHRIGGSVVQREIVERSYSSALLATAQTQEAADWLDPKLHANPTRTWMLRDRARAAEASGDMAGATLMRRRADLMQTPISTR